MKHINVEYNLVKVTHFLYRTGLPVTIKLQGKYKQLDMIPLSKTACIKLLTFGRMGLISKNTVASDVSVYNLQVLIRFTEKCS